jgi:hypothetical protein
MKLVEVIRGYNTSDEVTKIIMELSSKLGKIPTEVNDYPGFVANRILMPMINEAIETLYNGVGGVFQKQGVKILVDTAAASKIDVNRILAGFGADSDVVAYSTSAGTKEEVEVEGASEADLDRLTYEEQLDSLKTAMKLLMSNATNSLYLAGRGGCLAGKTEVNIQIG